MSKTVRKDESLRLSLSDFLIIDAYVSLAKIRTPEDLREMLWMDHVWYATEFEFYLPFYEYINWKENEKMNDYLKIIITFVIVALIICSILIWTYFQWTKCREMGFSIFYCLQHIS